MCWCCCCPHQPPHPTLPTTMGEWYKCLWLWVCTRSNPVCFPVVQCLIFFACYPGVRRCENMFPLLFPLFLNDLEEYIFICRCLPLNVHVSFSRWRYINNVYDAFRSVIYADDTSLVSETMEGLEQALRSFHSYCYHDKWNVNIEKTNVMVFGRGTAKAMDVFPVGDEIHLITNFKCLGGATKLGNLAKCKTNSCHKVSKPMFSLIPITWKKVWWILENYLI